MKRWLLVLVGGSALVAAVVAFFLWNASTVLRTPQEEQARELALVRDQCTRPEIVDRRLLQQSWYYDSAFQKLAGAFAESTFVWFRDGDPTHLVEGAFCISGSDLMVTYFERQFVPVSVKPASLAIEFGVKLKPLGKDTFKVEKLDEHRLVLFFESDRREHVFFRKN